MKGKDAQGQAPHQSCSGIVFLERHCDRCELLILSFDHSGKLTLRPVWLFERGIVDAAFYRLPNPGASAWEDERN